MPCYRASGIIEYCGEYLGHGQSKTAFELDHPGARFHGHVLKVARADDMEPSVFIKTAQANLTTSVLYNCHGVDADSGRRFHCWITDRTIPLDEFCRFDKAIKTRCSLAACILKAAMHGLYLSDCRFFNFGVQLTENATEHLVVIIDAGSRGIKRAHSGRITSQHHCHAQVSAMVRQGICYKLRDPGNVSKSRKQHRGLLGKNRKAMAAVAILDKKSIWLQWQILSREHLRNTRSDACKRFSA